MMPTTKSHSIYTTAPTYTTAIPTTYYQPTYTTQHPYYETTPFITTEEPGVTEHPTTYPPVTTETPVITTHPPVSSTTKRTGIKGHRHNFFTASTTDYPSTTQRVKGVKGGRRYNFVIPDNNEVPIVPPVRKTGIKGYRRYSQGLEPSAPSFELSDEVSNDKETRLNKAVHFYFAPRRQVRDLSHIIDDQVNVSSNVHLAYEKSPEEVDVKTLKGKKKPLKNVFVYDPESTFRGVQEDVKGHATYDIKRPDIKGRSGDRWKKYFIDNPMPSDW
uniref:Uncharacterized protein n=1 Tax=Cacopsylla melanoneura TaxID=428564 RepID=A0A8D8Y0L1_9HEMI